MPELPEVETVRQGLIPYVEGRVIKKVILNRPNIRRVIPADLAQKITDKKIKAVRRHGKTMIWDMDGVPGIAWHLGMSGSFRVNSEPKKHDHVVIELDDGGEIRFNDPRRFGALDYAGDLKGTDPYDPAFSASFLCAQLKKRGGPIKTVLLDQTIITGIGNIYACEALFLTKIHPATSAHTLSKKQGITLHAALIKVLDDAIRSGGSSLRDHVMVNGEAGKFQHHFNVYGRTGKPCPCCDGAIERLKQAGRSTFFCPQCQPAQRLG